VSCSALADACRAFAQSFFRVRRRESRLSPAVSGFPVPCTAQLAAVSGFFVVRACDWFVVRVFCVCSDREIHYFGLIARYTGRSSVCTVRLSRISGFFVVVRDACACSRAASLMFSDVLFVFGTLVRVHGPLVELCAIFSGYSPFFCCCEISCRRTACA
jgi:hypothetical protein